MDHEKLAALLEEKKRLLNELRSRQQSQEPNQSLEPGESLSRQESTSNPENVPAADLNKNRAIPPGQYRGGKTEPSFREKALGQVASFAHGGDLMGFETPMNQGLHALGVGPSPASFRSSMGDAVKAGEVEIPTWVKLAASGGNNIAAHLMPDKVNPAEFVGGIVGGGPLGAEEKVLQGGGAAAKTALGAAGRRIGASAITGFSHGANEGGAEQGIEEGLKSGGMAMAGEGAGATFNALTKEPSLSALGHAAQEEERKGVSRFLDYLGVKDNPGANKTPKSDALKDPETIARFRDIIENDLKLPWFKTRGAVVDSANELNARSAAAREDAANAFIPGKTTDSQGLLNDLNDRLKQIKTGPLQNDAQLEPLSTIARKMESTRPPAPPAPVTNPYATLPRPPPPDVPLSELHGMIKDVAGTSLPTSAQVGQPGPIQYFDKGGATALETLNSTMEKQGLAQGATPAQIDAYKTTVGKARDADFVASQLNSGGEFAKENAGTAIAPYGSKPAVARTIGDKFGDVFAPFGIKRRLLGSDRALAKASKLLEQRGQIPKGSTMADVQSLVSKLQAIGQMNGPDKAVYENVLAQSTPLYMELLREKDDEQEDGGKFSDYGVNDFKPGGVR